MKPIKIEHAHRAIHIDDGGQTGEALQVRCEGARVALEAALRDGIGREWICVEDELPPEAGWYAAVAYDDLIIACFDSDGDWLDAGNTMIFGGNVVTHWMPLPILPEVQK